MAAIFLCCGLCFCCAAIGTVTMFGILVWMATKLFYSISYSNSYYEAFFDFISYFYSWFVSVFNFFLSGTIFFAWNILPYFLIFALCQTFYDFIIKKIQELKKLKIEMMMDKASPRLDYYVDRMKIMRITLLMIFGFLVGLRFLTWEFFQNSFVMEIFAYGNVGLLMAFLMTEKNREAYDHNNINTKRTLFYNFVLIFISSLIIDDTFQMLTGYKFLFL